MAIFNEHGGPAPLQGFDVDVWVQDMSQLSGPGAASGPSSSGLILLGSFTSIVVTIRNATEAYLELNQRIPRYLDGEVQIAWVMEKGMLDVHVLQQTFGFSEMDRSVRFNRSPRFAITFNMDDYSELQRTVQLFGGQQDTMLRQPKGRFVLNYCKVDSYHVAATSGKQTVANQWQGVAEGIRALAVSSSGLEAVPSANTQHPGVLG